MKTTLNQLLGAALCLLATTTTAPAAGKGKGGSGGGGGAGGGSTLEGTIYYIGNAEGWSGTPSISMNADGSNQTVLGSGGYSDIFGTPSIHRHNTHRWFLKLEYLKDPDHMPTPEEPFKYLEHPDGAKRAQLVSLRDDCNVETPAPETKSLLLDGDPTLQILGPLSWLLDDNYVSFIARRWSSSDPDASVVGGGIYVLPVVFDADGNIAGLGELPTAPVVPLPLVPDDNPPPNVEAHPQPDVIEYSWNPAADMYAHRKRSVPGLWVADLVSGAEIMIATGYGPQWSPDGAWIAYGSGGSIEKIRPDGKRRTRLLQATSTWIFDGSCWAPDSRHLAFTGQAFEEGGINHDLFVMEANGGGLVNVTNTPGPTTEWIHPNSGGWR